MYVICTYLDSYPYDSLLNGVWCQVSKQCIISAIIPLFYVVPLMLRLTNDHEPVLTLLFS